MLTWLRSGAETGGHAARCPPSAGGGQGPEAAIPAFPTGFCLFIPTRAAFPPREGQGPCFSQERGHRALSRPCQLSGLCALSILVFAQVAPMHPSIWTIFCLE